jgi:hypothetical protein
MRFTEICPVQGQGQRQPCPNLAGGFGYAGALLAPDTLSKEVVPSKVPHPSAGSP